MGVIGREIAYIRERKEWVLDMIWGIKKSIWQAPVKRSVGL
jgi:hypothetical protein